MAIFVEKAGCCIQVHFMCEKSTCTIDLCVKLRLSGLAAEVWPGNDMVQVVVSKNGMFPQKVYSVTSHFPTKVYQKDMEDMEHSKVWHKPTIRIHQAYTVNLSQEKAHLNPKSAQMPQGKPGNKPPPHVYATR